MQGCTREILLFYETPMLFGDTEIVIRLFCLFLKNSAESVYVWVHSRGVKYTVRSLLQCCPRGIGSRSVFLTFCFRWGLFFAMFLNIQPTLQRSLPSSGCLGRQPRHKQLFTVPPPRSFAAFRALELSITNNLWMCIFTNVKSNPLKIWTCPPKI